MSQQVGQFLLKDDDAQYLQRLMLIATPYVTEKSAPLLFRALEYRRTSLDRFNLTLGLQSRICLIYLQRAAHNLSRTLEAFEIQGNTPLKILYSLKSIFPQCSSLSSFKVGIGPHHRAVAKVILDQAARHRLSPCVIFVRMMCLCGQPFCVPNHEHNELCNFLTPVILVRDVQNQPRLASCPAEIRS